MITPSRGALACTHCVTPAGLAGKFDLNVLIIRPAELHDLSREDVHQFIVMSHSEMILELFGCCFAEFAVSCHVSCFTLLDHVASRANMMLTSLTVTVFLSSSLIWSRFMLFLELRGCCFLLLMIDCPLSCIVTHAHDVGASSLLACAQV